MSLLASFFLQENRALADEQWQNKNARAEKTLGQAPLRQMRPEALGDRVRLDLMFWQGKLGIRGPSKTNSQDFDFYELHKPDTAHPVIVELMDEWRASPAPVAQGQVRFRAGLNGEKGLWLDMANADIKALMDEGKWITAALDKGWVIEAGQKGKAFAKSDAGISFVEAPTRCWLPSFDTSNEVIPLECNVASFSQPGPEMNRALIAAGFELLDESNLIQNTWAEWGAGYGNLSAAYANRLGSNALASEMDGGLYRLLGRNAERYFPDLKIEQWAAETSGTIAGNYDLWLLDPPRPGFGKLLEALAMRLHKPKYVLAYHCHDTGLENDSALLKRARYELVQWSSIDAFPATPHHEVVSLWRKK